MNIADISAYETSAESFFGQLLKNKYGQFKRICFLGTATKKRRSHTEILCAMMREIDSES